jgi:hypothetical protein
MVDHAVEQQAYERIIGQAKNKLGVLLASGLVTPSEALDMVHGTFGTAMGDIAATFYEESAPENFKAKPGQLAAVPGWIGAASNDTAEIVAELNTILTDMLVEDVRLTMIANAKQEKRVTFARYPSGNACKFCLMLASRGAVYTANTVNFEAHSGCMCMPVPVHAGQTYTPPKQAREWETFNDTERRRAAGGPGTRGHQLNDTERVAKQTRDQTSAAARKTAASSGSDYIPPTTLPHAQPGDNAPKDWQRTIKHVWERHNTESKSQSTKFPQWVNTPEVVSQLLDWALNIPRIEVPPDRLTDGQKAKLVAGELALAESHAKYVNIFVQIGQTRYEIRLSGDKSTFHSIDGLGVVRMTENGGHSVPLGSRPVAGWDYDTEKS